MPQNLLTVDLEEWFVVEALSDRFPYESWPELESTLERNCHRLLRLFHRHHTSATFFVVGWCAERYPDLIRQIADSGHEIACHSYRHRRVDSLTPEQFRDDTLQAIKAITDATGNRPIGYRAPSWSISDRVAWAFDILSELGFEYDSSIFPIKHDLYGMPSGPRDLFRMSFDDNRLLYELPATTARILGQNIPVGGGGYLRHSPYWYTRWMIQRLNNQGQPVIVYIHPWEIDPDPPVVEGLTALQRLRTYGSTQTLESKLTRLLTEFQFVSARDYINRITKRPIGF